MQISGDNLIFIHQEQAKVTFAVLFLLWLVLKYPNLSFSPFVIC